MEIIKFVCFVHGISFEVAQSVLFAEVSIELENRSHTEVRFISIGLSKLNKLLTVVYAYKDTDTKVQTSIHLDADVMSWLIN